MVCNDGGRGGGYRSYVPSFSEPCLGAGTRRSWKPALPTGWLLAGVAGVWVLWSKWQIGPGFRDPLMSHPSVTVPNGGG